MKLIRILALLALLVSSAHAAIFARAAYLDYCGGRDCQALGFPDRDCGMYFRAMRTQALWAASSGFIGIAQAIVIVRCQRQQQTANNSVQPTPASARG